MVNLPIFIRMVREAQGILQSELAKKIGVSQSAIAQFEKLKSTLSLETLLKLAPHLNLNPDFIEKGIGNPYKQTLPQKITKLFLAEDDYGKIDFSLVKIIAETNKTATFIFFKPILPRPDLMAKIDDPARKEIVQWVKQRRQGIATYAIFIHDDDSNSFLFKRKNNLLFNEQELLLSLQEIEAKDKKYFETDILNVNLIWYARELRNWHTLPDKELIEELLKLKHDFNRTMIHKIINEVWGYKTLQPDREGYDKVKTRINKMDKDNLERLLSHLIPELAKVISAHALSTV